MARISDPRHYQLMPPTLLSICFSSSAASRCAETSSWAAGHEAFAARGVADDGCGGGRRHAGSLSAGCRPLRSGRSAPLVARRGRTAPRRLRPSRRLRLIRSSRASLLPWPGRLSTRRPGSSPVHDASGSIARGIFAFPHHTPSMEVNMKRSRRVFLMMMGSAAVTTALPVAALAAPCLPDPRLLRNSNPDPMQDCTPSRGLPGNRFQQRMRAGG